MGYTGGASEAPTYHALGDHLEAVEVTFDSASVSYEELLEVFWRSHPSWLPPGPRRVEHAAFVEGESQRRLALASRDEIERRTGERVTTGIEPAVTFWPAEPMHQKFHLQRVAPELVRELARHAGGIESFLAGGAAARLNSYLAGFAGPAALAAAAAELELDPVALEARLDAARPSE